ncbi:MAG: FGGY-family carbohydrate kinase [Planctomycetes bacterium]|nr:FGGY-family carbohydrate kinase [Planctomycetota bacterium]
MSDKLLGIDYGTGGAKATLIDDAGRVLSYAFEEYSIIVPSPGWSEHKALLYWEVAQRLIKKVIADAQVNAKEIRGVAVSSALPSLVMVDDKGDPINNAYNLMDRRATKQVDWIRHNIGEERIFEISKNRLEDHPALVNLMWEKENRPADFGRISKALTIDGHITQKLTGRATLHYSGAAFYGVAYNLLEKRFDQEILDAIGIPADILPELFSCEEIVGGVTKAAAELMGLAEGTPVAAGQVDCNAGWIGGGATEMGDIQSNLGTCGNFGIIHNGTVLPNTMINFAYTTDSRHTYITVPTTTTGGGLIRYLRDNFYVAERASEAETGLDTYDLINQEAEKVAPGSDGLVMLPYLMGERTPIWDVNARGAIFGLSLNHTRGHVARAMMESVAYALYDSFHLIRDVIGEINYPLVLNEGGAKSVLWRRIITDVFGVPTVLVKRRIGAPYGDAILAGVATGVFKDFSVARGWTEYIDRMEPDEQRHQMYMEYFELYKNLYNHVKGDYIALADLRHKYCANNSD